jgi:hypothetical protein
MPPRHRFFPGLQTTRYDDVADFMRNSDFPHRPTRLSIPYFQLLAKGKSNYLLHKKTGCILPDETVETHGDAEQTTLFNGDKALWKQKDSG